MGGGSGGQQGGLRPTTTTQDIKGKFKFCEAFKFVKHFLFFQTGLKVGMLEETGARQPSLTTRAQPPCLGMPGGLLGQEGGVCLVSTGRALGREGDVRVRAVRGREGDHSQLGLESLMAEIHERREECDKLTR